MVDRGHLETIIFYCFVNEKTQGKNKKHREKTGNFVLIRAWQPCIWYVKLNEKIGL